MTSGSECRIILLGDSNVGKSTLILRFITGAFVKIGSATRVVECHDVEAEVDNFSSSVTILDTVGQEKYDSITNSYFRFCNVVLFVFDVTNRQSFLNLSHWFKRAHNFGCFSVDSTIDMYPVLVANKIGAVAFFSFGIYTFICKGTCYLWPS